jgi:thiol-disulfide isomerase/thioredoxin
MIFKHLLFLIGIFSLQSLVGLINSEFTFYLPLFQCLVCLYIIIINKLKYKLNVFFIQFSYSITLIILHIFLSLSLITYFFSFVTPVTIVLTLYLNKNPKFYKNLILLLIVLIYSFSTTKIIHPNLFYKNNYKLNYNKNLDVNFYDSDKQVFIFDKSKIYVLDFWTTSCSLCIEKFPAFHKLKIDFKKDNKIEFHTVNVTLPGDSNNKIVKLLKNKNLILDNLFINSDIEAKKISINDYPTILIIKNGKIFYNGYPSYDNFVIFNNLKSLIKDYAK